MKHLKLFNESNNLLSLNDYYIDLIYLLQDAFDELDIDPKTDENVGGEDEHTFWSIRLIETDHMDGISGDISNISELGDRTIKFIVVFNVTEPNRADFKKVINGVGERFKSQHEMSMELSEEEIDGYFYDYVIRII